MIRTKTPIFLALTVFALTISLADPAKGGIVSETSSNPSVATISATPDYAGDNFFFGGTGNVTASLITDTLLAGGKTTLTFHYSGFDFANEVRPVLNVVNNTGSTVTDLTFALPTNSIATFGYYATGTTSLYPGGASLSAATGYPFFPPLTIPLAIAPGDSLGVYLPFNLSEATGSFTLDQSTSAAIAAVPEPSTLFAAGVGIIGTLALRRRHRSA